MSDMEKDWDYLDENYKESENKVRSFEEIMAECKTLDDFDDDYDNILDSGVSLLKTVEDVKNVRELIAKGKSVKEIAADLGLEENYITVIAVTLNSSTDDDNDIAIAHLVMME